MPTPVASVAKRILSSLSRCLCSASLLSLIFKIRSLCQDALYVTNWIDIEGIVYNYLPIITVTNTDLVVEADRFASL